LLLLLLLLLLLVPLLLHVVHQPHGEGMTISHGLNAPQKEISNIKISKIIAIDNITIIISMVLTHD